MSLCLGPASRGAGSLLTSQRAPVTAWPPEASLPAAVTSQSPAAPRCGFQGQGRLRAQLGLQRPAARCMHRSSRGWRCPRSVLLSCKASSGKGTDSRILHEGHLRPLWRKYPEHLPRPPETLCTPVVEAVGVSEVAAAGYALR